MNTTRTLVTSLICFGLSTACSYGPRHIQPHNPKSRAYELPDLPERAQPEAGSLFTEEQVGWFEDNRAKAVGDLVVIRIDERESASRSDSTKLKKNRKSAKGIPEALGLMALLKKEFPEIQPDKLLSTNRESDFGGQGEIQRKGRLTATLPVRVRRVLPNGDFFVEGTNVVMVGAEEHHLYVSGIVRRVDIKTDNTVASSRIAEAHIESIGRGDVTDQQRPGWAARAMERGYPF